MKIDAAPADGHAGDLAPAEAWKVLGADTAAQLVDVRTQAEWTFVGVPDLSSLEKSVQLVEWQSFPGMERAEGFVERVAAGLEAAGAGPETPVIFICRSGARSAAAARAMAAAGFANSYNLDGGFEGDLDTERHRGGTTGWKAQGLPWSQS